MRFLFFASVFLYGGLQEDPQVTSVHFHEYLKTFFSTSFVQLTTEPQTVTISFRAAEEELKYADCLCGQKKNFAEVRFSKVQPIHQFI